MSSSPITIRPLTSDQMPAWDVFVDAAPDATFFHRSGWKTAIEQAFGHDCPYLMAEAGGQVVGVLPLTRIKSLLFGHALVSTGFGVYGGPVGNTPGASAALVEAAIALGDQHDVDHIALRALQPLAGLDETWAVRSDAHATFRKEIDPDPDVNLKAIPRKQRAVVRKSLERGLHSEVDDDVDRFFPLYAISVRNLGTPVFPKSWFRALKDVFGDECELMTVLERGEAVSAVLSFYFRDEVLPYYAGGTPVARRLGGHDFMYYDLMCRAAARGCTRFDFGRSKTGSGAFSFKKNFGFTPEPLHYAYYVRKGDEMPDISPNNPKYQAMIKLWSRLPLPVANLIGPRIARSLG